MHNTREGNRVRKIRGHEYLTVGERVGNCTTQKHYQVEYPNDLNLDIDDMQGCDCSTHDISIIVGNLTYMYYKSYTIFTGLSESAY